MNISRRQFLRACMYAAPAAIVAPKAISYFLPPRIDVATPLEMNLVAWGSSYVDSDIVRLIQRRMNEAMNSMVDNIATKVYATSPEEWVGAADQMARGRHGLYALDSPHLKDVHHFTVMGVPVVLDPEMPPGRFEFRNV